MLTHALNYTTRRWAYGFGEVVSMAIFGFTFFRFFTDSRYRFGDPFDPGMARATAACFVLVSAATFVLTNCIKRLDTGK